MISLIVATLGNRPEEMGRLLDSIKEQQTSVETIIVDQSGSAVMNEHTAGAVRNLGTSQRGLSRARNIGMREAAGTILAFPDDDCWYSQGVLKRVAAIMEDASLDGIVGRLYDPVLGEEVNRAYWPRKSFRITRLRALIGSSVTMFFRSSVVGTTVFFDENFGAGAEYGAGEETDLLFSILGQGCNVAYRPDIVVYHSAVPLGMTPRRAFAYGKGFGALARKGLHSGSVVLMPFVAKKVIASVLKTCFYLFWKFDKARYSYCHLRGLMLGFFSYGRIVKELRRGTVRVVGSGK